MQNIAPCILHFAFKNVGAEDWLSLSGFAGLPWGGLQLKTEASPLVFLFRGGRLAQPYRLRRTSVGGATIKNRGFASCFFISGRKIGSAFQASPDFRWGGLQLKTEASPLVFLFPVSLQTSLRLP